MKRLIALAIAAVGVASFMVLPASPASADTAVCAGTGVATLTGDTLEYPVPSQAAVGGPFSTAGFTFGLTGVCVPGGGLTAGGTVNGWCGDSYGNGTANVNHDFGFVGLGSVLIISGEVIGVVQATPDATTGHSCTTGAGRFLVQGAGLGWHGL